MRNPTSILGAIFVALTLGAGTAAYGAEGFETGIGWSGVALAGPGTYYVDDVTYDTGSSFDASLDWSMPTSGMIVGLDVGLARVRGSDARDFTNWPTQFVWFENVRASLLRHGMHLRVPIALPGSPWVQGGVARYAQTVSALNRTKLNNTETVAIHEAGDAAIGGNLGAGASLWSNDAGTRLLVTGAFHWLGGERFLGTGRYGQLGLMLAFSRPG